MIDHDKIKSLQSAFSTLKLIEKAEHSLSAFIKTFWPIVEPGAQYVHGWHIDAISEHLEAVSSGEINRLVINVPPGHMKSLILNVFWPAWEWGARKQTYLRYLKASHKQDLSVRDNMKLRNLICSSIYQKIYPHVILKRDQNSKKKFENTELGFSESMAAGSVTGSRGDRVLIDDPLSVEDGNSKIILATREFWFKEAIPTRVTNPSKSAIIVIMQRLNERDTTHLALEQGYEHLMLPMEFEPERRCKTSIGFVDPREQEGELLFPERFPRAVVDRDKKSLGSFGHAAQNQQRPAPREGAIIKLSWLSKRYTIPRNQRGEIDLLWFSERIQSIDTAFKEGEHNDYSVIGTWGIRENGFYLIHVARIKCDYPTLEQRVKELAAHFKPTRILIEDKASGQSLIQSLRKRTTLPIKPIQVDRDKVARAYSVSAYFEAGRVILPEGEIWLNDYMDEVTKFPGSQHDDQVDMTTQFLLEIALRREVEMKKIAASIIAR